VRRVLLTVHKFFPDHRAGTEVLTLKVAQELQKRDFEVLVVTANPPDLDARHMSAEYQSEYVYEGVPVRVFDEKLRLEGFTFDHEYNHPQMKTHFASILHEFQPDVVHIFHAQNLSASIIDAAHEQNVPVVCSTTDFWFVCPIVQLKRADGSICRGPDAGAKNCLSCYTPRLFPPLAEFEGALATKYPQIGIGLKSLPAPLRRLAAQGLFQVYKSKKREGAVNATINRIPFLRDAANSVRAIMVPTKLMRDIFIENGIDEKLLHLVHFGIDTAPLEPFQTKTESPELRIGFIGTLFEHKGVDLLVEAFQQLPADAQAVLKIYGDPKQFPEYGEKLIKMAQRPGGNSSKIQFLGAFPNNRLGPVLSEIDVLVVPSRWYENTPLVIQSALATKTPLVATNLGGLSELIIHEKNGLLFELNDVNSLKNQLARLLNDRAFLRTLTDNIKPERTIPEMVNDIEDIYERKAGLRPVQRAGVPSR
jgi:glycosyltransferase involved in cell wall biosynthesis